MTANKRTPDPSESKPPTPSETQLTLLEKQIIEALDDYHDRGLFHEYTPLEKKRYAAFITALFTQALTSVKNEHSASLRQAKCSQGHKIKL